ncbi:hypothetical protein EX895_004155 [Sporisorium graminicola]|uniref:Uncharacterized protein n=1 Tax=Sporisorium graminicola TaxID=280036 RepID=A0A4U7KS96_9BASI|nr:hypothetical protein EX895_004155 [Sporisorium graminicola]TKY86867.1 hypothetical protein EX895_004155 [Sporisorium graminicola]
MATANHHHYSFVPDPHTTEYLALNDRSTSPARKLWPFNRSRSSSPNTQGQQHLSLDTSVNGSTSRSRKSSANSNNNGVSPSGSASSFVVKSVVRSPGGVSLPTSPANDHHPQNYFAQGGARQQSPSPAARRMTLEDSDDDMGQHEQQQHLQYRRSKSKPLGAVTSLGVPPGGPGGGVGYGTARSSNDGRPESAGGAPSPFYRPASPSGSITAGDFQRSAKERGRSPRQSASGSSGSPSAHSAASSSGKKPVARITAGPRSLAQQQQDEHHQQYQQQQQQEAHFQQHPQQHPSSRGPSPAAAAAGPRNAGLAGPRHFPGGPPSPSGPGYQSHPQQHPHAAGPPGSMGFPLLPPQHTPGHEGRDESPSRSRRFSFGIASRLRKDSEKGASGPAPLDGLPSPVDIPFGRSPHSPLRFDNGAETDYSRATSPFGSVSPARVAGSPNSSGFLSTLMGRQAADEREARQNQHQQQPRHRDDGPRSCSPSGGSNLAGKWFKGVFGRSPRADEKDPNYASDLSPFPLTVSGTRDAEDEAAYAQKLSSMRQARHIVDEERQRHMMGPTTPTGVRGAPGTVQRFDPNHDREFRPRQVVDSDAEAGNVDSDADADAAMEFELGRKKSPPGRKPVPAYLPGSTPRRDADGQSGAPAQDEKLTPAQRIIQETRSKQLAREQIEAQRQEAAMHQQKIANSNPRETLAANAQFNGPPTPPKGNDPALQGHQQRFPSGAHQITREPATRSGGPPPQSQPIASAVSGQRNGSTLAPGSGPMPADLPLRDALQEMMVRFYRFERYSVPLIRSLETRLLDIERDAMLANNPQARSSGTRASIASNHSAEMDRWVNQMTSLMKHEVGQLKAATKEIKESREIVAAVARSASASGGPGVALSMSVSSFGSLAAITPTTSVQQIQTQRPIAEVTERQTNVSSSTFESAVPLGGKLGLPAGAKPALDRDEGKHGGAASPTKANFGFASESAKEHKENKNMLRDRSVSPNGRPRFTSVLGQPLANAQAPQQAGRLSPAPSSSEDRAQGQAGMPRDTSVENRLKALMSPSGASSRSTSPARPQEEAVQEREEKADESGSSDIAAALAAIDASSFTAAEDALSDHSLQQRRQQEHHVPVSKSASHSSSNSGSASGSMQEPLTPTAELADELNVAAAAAHGSGKGNFSGDSGIAGSVLPYLTRGEGSAPTSPVKAQFGAAPPAVVAASGRISPQKLFAHKFAASGGSSGSTYTVGGGGGGGASGANSPSASTKLGLVERKRFTLPAAAVVSPSTTTTSGATTTGTASTAAPTTLGTGTVTTVPARQAGRVSRSPSYTLDDSAMVAGVPTSAAFSGLAKVKPVGHLASLKERVAFFDSAK